ncbi:MAG TPA: PDGLE domain-containing protein [Nocardioidaceae bacterium]|nr:PDGLE domain-containing protein [Nocardioidaceae bacterium]
MSRPTRPNRRRFYVAFAVVALLLAGVVSSFASSSPDGLERVADDQGMAQAEKEHDLADSPLADYGIGAIDNGLVSGGVAGVVGVLVVLTLTAGLTLAVRRKNAAGRGS